MLFYFPSKKQKPRIRTRSVARVGSGFWSSVLLYRSRSLRDRPPCMVGPPLNALLAVPAAPEG